MQPDGEIDINLIADIETDVDHDIKCTSCGVPTVDLTLCDCCCALVCGDCAGPQGAMITVCLDCDGLDEE